jgi:Tfp pilus assembly protein PilN
MRAVNLMGAGSGHGGGRAGAGAYVLIAVLGVLLAGVLATVLTNNAIVAHRAELSSLTTQVRVAQAEANATRPYREFATLAQARVATVRQLGQARFDWHRALGDLSKVMPDNVWLSSLLGTVAVGVSVEGAASGATGSVRAALPNPAIELTGCTTGHDSVARLISRLRAMDGVTRVALADSTKDDVSGGGNSADCRHGNARFPQFDVVVFYQPLPALPTAPQPGTTDAAATAGTAAPPATGGATAPAQSSAPASTTPPTSTAPAGGTPAASSASSNGSDMR